ncbi:MAG: hypothetical protein JW817_02745 [Clostridiales bacterium]|nr:hypothetical protein [Clostridiales bacterium]
MKRLMKQGTILLIALTLSAVMITTSCGLLEGRADDSKAVESAVSDFLDSISDGSYEKDDYKSSFSKDKSFAKLKFEEEDAEKLMGIAFKKVSFKITDAEGDEKSEEGTCKVTLTAIDLEKILEDLEEGYDYDALEEAIEAKKAPTDDHKIVFELEYDGEDWLISDLSELSDILGKPFTGITFEEPEPEPEDFEAMAQETAEQLMVALKDGDFSAVEQMTDGYYTDLDFFQEDWVKAGDVYDSLFGDMSWEIGEVTAYSDTEYYVDIDLTYKLYTDPVEAFYSDTNKMVDIVKPVILGMIIDPDDIAPYENYMDSIAIAVISGNAAAQSTTETISVDLLYDETTKVWTVTYIPYVFLSCADFGNNFDPLYNYTYNDDDVISDQILNSAADALLAEGSITQEQYDSLVGDEMIPGETGTLGEYTKESVEAAIDQQGWFDYETSAFVTSYGPNTADIGYLIFFTQAMPGLSITCEFFVGDDTVSVYTEQYTMEEDFDYYDTGITANTVFPADTYRVVLTLADGTVLVDQSVQVTE